MTRDEYLERLDYYTIPRAQIPMLVAMRVAFWVIVIGVTGALFPPALLALLWIPFHVRAFTRRLLTKRGESRVMRAGRGIGFGGMQ